MGSPLALGLQGAGLGTGLAGSYLQAKAEQQQLADKQAADLQNQDLAKMQAASALQRGGFQAFQLRQRSDTQQSEQRAGFAASGVNSGSGTAAAVQAITGGVGNADAEQAMHNAAQQAWGFQVTANQYGAQAEQDKRAEGQVLTGAVLGGIGGGLAGASRLYGAARENLGGGIGVQPGGF